MAEKIESEKLDADKAAGQQALDHADLQTLHQLFQDKCEEVDMLIHGVGVMAANKNTGPRPDGVTVQAMRDVALAAISLAERIACTNGKATPDAQD